LDLDFIPACAEASAGRQNGLKFPRKTPACRRQGWRARVAGEPMAPFPNWRRLIDNVRTYWMTTSERFFIPILSAEAAKIN